MRRPSGHRRERRINDATHPHSLPLPEGLAEARLVARLRREAGMKEKQGSIAACGIDCAACDIRLAPTDPAIRLRIVDWLRTSRHVKVKPEDIRCSGCRGDRALHWSPDCWILHCCVDERGHAFCSDCSDFPCERLVSWSGQNEGYGRALKRLKERTQGA
jgi:hypothetical protein